MTVQPFVLLDWGGAVTAASAANDFWYLVMTHRFQKSLESNQTLKCGFEGCLLLKSNDMMGQAGCYSFELHEPYWRLS